MEGGPSKGLGYAQYQEKRIAYANLKSAP